MKSSNDKNYLSRWNNQRIELQLLKQEIESLKAERDGLRKLYEEDKSG